MQTIVVHTAAPPVNIFKANNSPGLFNANALNPFTLPMMQELDIADMARRRRRGRRRYR